MTLIGPSDTGKRYHVLPTLTLDSGQVVKATCGALVDRGQAFQLSDASEAVAAQLCKRCTK